MNWIEILLITAGISLDVFGAVACQGALVAKINKKTLVVLCALFAAWQTGALYFGSILAGLLCKYDIKDNPVRTGRIIAAAIFIILGLRMIRKAAKEGSIVEKREDVIPLKSAVRILALITCYTILTGVGFGFLSTQLILVLPMVAIVTAAAVAFGVYTGYRLGSEQKTKAYIIGSILLLIGGIDVIFRYVIR